MFTCDLYARSPPPHDLERLRTTMQRRVVDFVRVGYFIPFNGPLNGHPPSYTNTNATIATAAAASGVTVLYSKYSRLARMYSSSGNITMERDCGYLVFGAINRNLQETNQVGWLSLSIYRSLSLSLSLSPSSLSLSLSFSLSHSLSLYVRRFHFVRGEVLPATSSPPHLIVFSTRLCLLACLLIPVFLPSCQLHISLNTALPPPSHFRIFP